MQVPYLAHPWGCHLHPFGSLTAIFFKSYALKKNLNSQKSWKSNLSGQLPGYDQGPGPIIAYGRPRRNSTGPGESTR